MAGQDADAGRAERAVGMCRLALDATPVSMPTDLLALADAFHELGETDAARPFYRAYVESTEHPEPRATQRD